MSETLEYWRAQAKHWEREYFQAPERGQLAQGELGELRHIRDYLLQELEHVAAKFLLPDESPARRAIERVQQRAAECANGWVGPAWDWPQRRTDRREG